MPAGQALAASRPCAGANVFAPPSRNGGIGVNQNVSSTIRELLESTIETMEALLDATDAELPLLSSHVCAQGKDLWALITNDIDHEKIHVGQVVEGRYEARLTPSPM